MTGLGQAQNLNGEYEGEFTEVPAGGSIKATINYYAPSQPLSDYPPYRLRLPLLVGKEVDGRYVNVKKSTFMIDVNEAK